MSADSKLPEALSLDLCREIFDRVDDGVFFVDIDRRITFWNRGAERLTGMKSSEVVGRICGPDILGHIDAEGASLCPEERCPLVSTICGGASITVATSQRCSSGQRLSVFVSTLPLVDRTGKTIGGIEIFTDLPERRRGAERLVKLEETAYLDDLTGIANRHFFRTSLEARFTEACREDSSFGLLMADIDHFKRINDEHGHVVGDGVLRVVARTLAQACRPTDLVCRWGGEEFAVITSNANREELGVVAERLRRAVEAVRYIENGLVLGVTLSIGATLAREDDTPDSLLKRSDQLLYAAKESGRNQVVLDDAQSALDGPTQDTPGGESNLGRIER